MCLRIYHSSGQQFASQIQVMLSLFDAVLYRGIIVFRFQV